MSREQSQRQQAQTQQRQALRASDGGSGRPALPPDWSHDAETLARLRNGVWPGSVRRRDQRDGPLLQVDLRGLVMADFDELYDLHRLVIERLPHPHVFRADDRDFMRRHIDERGWTVGAFLDGRMVGYAVVAFPREESDNLGRDLPLPPALVDRSAHYDGSAVHPDFRGSLLHRQMNALRGCVAIAGGYHQLFGTVSPLNPYSLRNHFAAGFMVKGLLVKYGGMDRLLIHRDGRLQGDCLDAPTVNLRDLSHRQIGDRSQPANAHLGEETLVALDDVPAQRKLLDRGFWGWRIEVVYGEPPRIAYAPAARLSAVSGESEPATAIERARAETTGVGGSAYQGSEA